MRPLILVVVGLVVLFVVCAVVLHWFMSLIENAERQADEDDLQP